MYPDRPPAGHRRGGATVPLRAAADIVDVGIDPASVEDVVVVADQHVVDRLGQTVDYSARGRTEHMFVE